MVRLAVADLPEQAVALGQGTRVGGEMRPVHRIVRPGELVERRPPQGRRADDEEHLLGREEDGPQMLSQGRGTARDAIHQDPLAPAGLEGNVQRDARRRHTVERGPEHPGFVLRRRWCLLGPHHTHDPLDPQEVGAPADKLGIDGSSMRTAQRQQHDALEQSRLPGCVRTPDELRPGTQREVQ